MVVGFIGSGNMAAAMARGWAKAEGGPSRMLFTDSGSGRATALAKEVGGEAVPGNAELVERSECVVLAVKPSSLGDVSEKLPAPGCVLSLLGATRLSVLEEHFPGSTVIRLMPNLAVEVGNGVICAAHDRAADGKAVTQALELLTPLGEVVDMEDSAMDAATAVMGCTPAYFAVIADTLAKVGVAEGLDPDVSLSMVARTLAGTADLLERRTPFEIQVAVASPGGSTEAGLEALEREDASGAFREAARASLARMRGQ